MCGEEQRLEVVLITEELGDLAIIEVGLEKVTEVDC